jgi:spore coat protein U-like protein
VIARHRLAVIAALLVLTLFAGRPAYADLDCTASVTNANFGAITVRDGTVDRTTATVTFTCANGIPNTPVRACLTLGAGSGGATSGNATRSMRRADGATLNYTLRSGSHTGAVWTSVTTDSRSNATGRSNFTATIFAEVTSTGAQARGGSYQSAFTGADAVLTYGQGNCGQAGGSVSFTVAANVTQSCTLSVAPLAFGTISSLDANIDAESAITANCTTGLPYAITLGMGNGSGVTSPAARKMTKGTDSLNYGIYRDQARSLAWGNQATNDVDGSGTGSAQSIPVYGRIPPQPMPPAGTYSDTVIVTITY